MSSSASLALFLVGALVGWLLARWSEGPRQLEPILPGQWYELPRIGPVEIYDVDDPIVRYWRHESSRRHMSLVAVAEFRSVAKFLPHHNAPVELLEMRKISREP